MRTRIINDEDVYTDEDYRRQIKRTILQSILILASIVFGVIACSISHFYLHI